MAANTSAYSARSRILRARSPDLTVQWLQTAENVAVRACVTPHDKACHIVDGKWPTKGANTLASLRPPIDDIELWITAKCTACMQRWYARHLIQRDAHFLSEPSHPRNSGAAFSTAEFSSRVFLTLPHFAVTCSYLPPFACILAIV